MSQFGVEATSLGLNGRLFVYLTTLSQQHASILC